MSCQGRRGFLLLSKHSHCPHPVGSPYHSGMLPVLPVAAAVKYHSLSVLKQEKFIHFWFWRPKDQTQGGGKTTFASEAAGQIPFLACFSFWWLLSFLGLQCHPAVSAFTLTRPSPLCPSSLSCVSHKEACYWNLNR